MCIRDRSLGFSSVYNLLPEPFGFLSVPFFKFIATNIQGAGIYFEKIDVMLPAVLVSLLCGYVVTIIDKDKSSAN